MHHVLTVFIACAHAWSVLRWSTPPRSVPKQRSEKPLSTVYLQSHWPNKWDFRVEVYLSTTWTASVTAPSVTRCLRFVWAHPHGPDTFLHPCWQQIWQDSLTYVSTASLCKDPTFCSVSREEDVWNGSNARHCSDSGHSLMCLKVEFQ